MIKSMTGFGRWEESNDERKIIVEMKAVNHRYCDISVKMPKKLFFFEAGIRNLVKKYIARGKVDIYITYEDFTQNNVNVKYNEQIARNYMNCFEKMSKEFQIEKDIKVSNLSRFPDVLTVEEQTPDEDKIWKLIEKAILLATNQLVQVRVSEGNNLKTDLLSKLEEMTSCVDFIERKSPQIVEDYRNKITSKVEELLGETRIDESILATEITVFADKVCVDEETVRLKSHISNMISTLESKEGVGRKLDFIAQEMNREANTILSKVNDLDVTNVAINLKTEIEKIREQIQNIE
jgi:uncharacterized protein (TIGR00255 family)